MKTQNPWMGRFRGSAGNMTGCKVYDKNVLRAKAFEVANPNTTAQQTQRNFFKQLAGLTATFSDEQLRTLFGQKPKAMSRRNALSKQLAASYVIDGGKKEVDFASITTLGNAQTMDFGTTVLTRSRGTVIVALDAVVSGNTSLQPYQFIVALVNDTKGEIYMPLASASVETGSLTVSTPATWTDGDDVHCIPFITNSTTDVSTIGFGTLAATKRPEKKTRQEPTRSTSVTVYFNGDQIGDMVGVNLEGTTAVGGTPSELYEAGKGTRRVVADTFVSNGDENYVASLIDAAGVSESYRLVVTMPNEETVTLTVNYQAVNL